MKTKACYLHLGVTKSGIVKYVKVTAYRSVSTDRVFQHCSRHVKDFETLHSFGWDFENRRTEPFKKLLDSVYNQDLVIAVIREMEGRA